MEQKKEKADYRVHYAHIYPIHSAQMMNFMEQCTNLKLDIKFIKDIKDIMEFQDFDNIDMAMKDLNIVKFTADEPESIQKPGCPKPASYAPDYFIVMKPKKMKKLINKFAGCRGNNVNLSSDVMLTQLNFNFPINVTDIIYDCAYKLLNFKIKPIDEVIFPTFYDEYMHMDKNSKSDFWKNINICLTFNIKKDASYNKTIISIGTAWNTGNAYERENMVHDLTPENCQFTTNGATVTTGYTWNMKSQIAKRISEKSNEMILKFPSLYFTYEKYNYNN